MWFTFAPLIGTIARLPKTVVVAGGVYAAGAVASGVKSALNGDGIGTVAKKTAQSWFGMRGNAPIPKKRKHVAKAKQVKALAKKAMTTGNPKDLAKATAAAKAIGIS